MHQYARRAIFRVSILAACFGGFAFLTNATCASAAPAASSTAKAISDPDSYAEKISLLVRQQNIDALAALPALTSQPKDKTLNQWRQAYITAMQKAAAQSTEEYLKETRLAHQAIAKNKLITAMGYTLAAYAVAPDRATFRHLPWVIKLTNQVSARAKSDDQNGHWLESLQLYSALNSLYKISMRFNSDLQRVIRRTTLLAIYTPKLFYQMQEKLLKQRQAAAAATSPAKAPKATVKVPPPTFSHWQTAVKGIDEDMLLEAMEEAEHRWVKPVDYQRLILGGINALELFPKTPELAHPFPGLAKAENRTAFSTDLRQIAETVKSAKQMNSQDMINTWETIRQDDKQTVHLPKAVLIKEFTDGAFGTLDPFSMVFWPSEVADFKKEMSGTFGGVGIEITTDNGMLKVISPLVGTPAFRAGIEAGDIIATVNGRSTAGMSINQAIRRIMGKPNTYVTLGIQRLGHKGLIQFRLMRVNIEVHSIKGCKRNPASDQWQYMIDPVNRIGYIRVTQFQQDTAEQLQHVLHHLLRRHVRGLIIDLRFNPGGYLETALKMVNMFVNQGTILSIRGRSTTPHSWAAQGDPLVPLNIPLIVLINQDSASASEIFSGAMRDLHRGLIVGHRSYGKGSVQNVIPIGQNANALLKLTMNYYYLPNGECIQRQDHAHVWGVQPDVNVPFSPKQLIALQMAWQNDDIIPAKGDKAPITKLLPAHPLKQQEAFDTQLDTALLLMRLQLVQSQ